MSYYQCKRCLFISKQKTGMIRHLERKNKCVKLFQAYKFDDFELYKMSLVIIKKKDQKKPHFSIRRYKRKFITM